VLQKEEKKNKKAVSDLIISFLFQFHPIRACGAMWCWQTESVLECARTVILKASCDVEVDSVETFCSCVAMRMTDSVHGMQNQGLLLEQQLPVR